MLFISLWAFINIGLNFWQSKNFLFKCLQCRIRVCEFTSTYISQIFTCRHKVNIAPRQLKQNILVNHCQIINLNFKRRQRQDTTYESTSKNGVRQKYNSTGFDPQKCHIYKHIISLNSILWNPSHFDIISIIIN